VGDRDGHFTSAKARVFSSTFTPRVVVRVLKWMLPKALRPWVEAEQKSARVSIESRVKARHPKKA
jgi:hypothetical protein